ncbi:MAG: tagaturonate epimerase family protein [Bacteroidota bacterium]|nr:tagaturonate epimerase family protein [Bacteroidota bacterium]
MKLRRFSFGVGDRFAMQGEAQLRAIMKANEAGIQITPVWNKSNREHSIVHTKPQDTRIEADSAVKSLQWGSEYFVDADHINMTNVDGFVQSCDFFTIDVAGFIGKSAKVEDIYRFVEGCARYKDRLIIPGLATPLVVGDKLLYEIAENFLAAIQEAGSIYRHIASDSSDKNFVVEISMDEVERAQSPVELFFILKMIADQQIPADTIAPKFTGRFNKGVDYVGDLKQFRNEFEADLLGIDYAVKEFGLPTDLKLSVHSGSDKFSIYPVMKELLQKYDKGIHVKTAGTTWLEEVIGLAVAGGEALDLAKLIYRNSYSRRKELCAPYADVIDINPVLLPLPDVVDSWNSKQFADTLRHIPGHPDYNPNFRQLIHVGYKIAAELGDSYYALVKKYAPVIGRCVEENLYERHLKRLFDL